MMPAGLNPSNYPQLQGRRLLVVDDESDLRDVVLTLFRRLGCEIIEAENGHRASEILRTDPTIDVVITDVRMSGGDGVELLDQIRRRASEARGLRAPAVILITGFSDLGENEAIRRGAFAVIAKPFRLHVLVDAVSAALPVQEN